MKMDLEQQWKNMGTAEDTHGTITFHVPDLHALEKTASPMHKIKKSLVIGMVWIIVLLVVYVAGLVSFKPVITKLSLIILAAYSVYCFIQSLKLYRQIDPMIIVSNSVKTELERHYNSIFRWCKTQERNAIFLYPVSFLGGAFLGLTIDGPEKMNQIMHKTSFWVTLGIFTMAFIPILYYINRQMMKAAYYGYLLHLKQLITSFEEVNTKF